MYIIVYISEHMHKKATNSNFESGNFLEKISLVDTEDKILHFLFIYPYVMISNIHLLI